MKRILTALVLIPIALYSVFWAPYAVFVAVAIAFALLCFHEYAALVEAHGIVKPGLFAYAVGLLMFLNPAPVLLAGILALVAAMRFGDLRQSLPYAAAVALGALYIFGAWRAAVDLRAIAPYWLLFALAINWVGDIAAFYVGRAIGRRKLSPNISPGKSWEGAVGSMAGAIAFGVAFRWYYVPAMGLWVIVALSVIGNVAGQVGDLAESALKRGAGVKDSGSLLPGHGGFLDRLDSSLFSMPAVLYALQFITFFLTR
jgi:phosphatidate cytidylyltransferase